MVNFKPLVLFLKIQFLKLNGDIRFFQMTMRNGGIPPSVGKWKKMMRDGGRVVVGEDCQVMESEEQ